MPRGAAVIRYEGRRGVVWRVKYADADGRQVMETVGREADGVTRKQAEAELRERLVRVDRRQYRRPAALTFRSWSATWFEEGQHRRSWRPATIVQYRVAIRYLDGYFGSTRVDAIRPRDVAGYIREHHGRFSAKYVQLQLNVLHDIFKTAVAQELVPSNPVAGVERPKVVRKRWRILEPQEVPRVRKAFSDERARRMFLAFVLTGLRRSELAGLRWGSVNLVEGTLRVVEAKSEEGERLVALPPTLVDELAAQYQSTAYRADTDLVFAHPTRGSRPDMNWFRACLDEALAEAGVTERVRIHDLRHTALTNMAAAGSSPIAVMATAGHRSMQTTKQYVHLAGVAFAQDAAALEARLLAGRTFYPNEPTSADLSEPRPSEHAPSGAH